MYLGRWRQSWPGLEDLARTNKLAARSEAGHVSWLISGRIRFPFVHATLPSVGFLSIGIPLYLRQFKFLAPGGRLQAPAPSNFFRIAAMMIPERRSISNTYSCILFLFTRREPVSRSQWNNRIALELKILKTFCRVIGEDYSGTGESNWKDDCFELIILYIGFE